MENALPNSEGKSPRNVLAAVDDFTDLPTRWQGYEGVDFVILSTGRPRFPRANRRAARPDRSPRPMGPHAGGTLVLLRGEQRRRGARQKVAAGAVCAGTLRSHSRISTTTRSAGPGKVGRRTQHAFPSRGEKVDLPGRPACGRSRACRAPEADVPLVVRAARGLGQVVFVAVDLDGPIDASLERSAADAGRHSRPARQRAAARKWPPRRAMATTIWPGNCGAALELFRGVRLVPFFVVATLAVGLHPADRSRRLLSPPPVAARHGLDVDDVPGRRGRVRRGRPLGLVVARSAT